MITILLFLLAGINVLTKTKATISGTIFTIIFFAAFTLSERYHKAKKPNQTRRHTNKTLFCWCYLVCF
jgi:predicted membrane channel-forming protein YqfA (hemolysin III family)